MKATKSKKRLHEEEGYLSSSRGIPLLDAAFELAATKGMADHHRQQSKRGVADVTKRAFFHHFDSEEDVGDRTGCKCY